MLFESSPHHQSPPLALSTHHHHYPNPYDIDLLDSSEAKQPDPQLMSTPLFRFTDPFGDCSPDLYDLNNTAEDTLSDHPAHSDPLVDPTWQFWSNGAYSHVPNVQRQYSHDPPQQQQYHGSHGRALSTSSEISYSPDSPYSRASSIQYPSTYNPRSQYLAPSWDGYSSSSPVAPVQHLPTPVHTPTADAFMETKSARRSRHSNTPDSALAAHRSMRSALTHQSSSGNINVSVSRHVPKFDRTMSDIYQDELYNPPTSTSMPTSASTATSMPAPQQPASSQHQTSRQLVSAPQNLVSDRLNAAYLERSSSPGHQSRGPSPYAQASSYANAQENDSAQEQPRTAAAMREQNKARADAIAYAQHLSRDDTQQQQTVSPKDAFPTDQIQEEESMPSLFPASSDQSNASETTATYGPHNAEQPYDFNSSFNLGFTAPSVPASQLLSSADERRNRRRGQGSSGSAMDGRGGSDFSTSPPARLVSMDTTNSDSEEVSDQETSTPGRPRDTTARAGTYTCTYHGCTDRFRTPSELQKHKREDHRSTGAIGLGSGATAGGSASPNTAATSMTQAGPHKCTRINPSTNKPCNTVFSRPYDLTRHEDTIHAERKKVRCPHCDEEKTFSRADALTRHLRVVHPHVSFPGKHRRRHD